MPFVKSRLVGIVEIPEVPLRDDPESAARDRDDMTLKQAFHRLAASPRRTIPRRSRLAPNMNVASASIVYADLGQLCSELKAEAARLQGRFLG